MSKKEEHQKELVDDWNKKWKVGQKVLVRKDDGEEVETVTSGMAVLMCGTAVCWGNKISGAYMLERFRAMAACYYCKAVITEPWPHETKEGWPVCAECGDRDNVPMFYLQDKRGYVGNDISWWKDGGGYTTDLAKAEVFTRAEANKHYLARKTDVPWPKKYIDKHAIRVIDMQDVDYNTAMKEAE